LFSYLIHLHVYSFQSFKSLPDHPGCPLIIAVHIFKSFASAYVQNLIIFT